MKDLDILRVALYEATPLSEQEVSDLYDRIDQKLDALFQLGGLTS